jgi:hypothetical protein
VKSPPPRYRPPPPPPESGSFLRLLAGLVLFIAALTVAAFGFRMLVIVLDGGGYGTLAMRQALIVLGVAGAGLAAAIATVIWDIAKRYER